MSRPKWSLHLPITASQSVCVFLQERPPAQAATLKEPTCARRTNALASELVASGFLCLACGQGWRSSKSLSPGSGVSLRSPATGHRDRPGATETAAARRWAP
jgi:hypothetical protein